MEHFIRKRQPNMPETGSPEDKINTRVQALRDFIKYDKQEQEVLQENLGKLSDSPGNETFRNMLEGKIKSFERKIRTKTDLIELLRQRLPA